MDPVEVVAVVFITLAGLAIGSFLNVVIWRVPRGESIVSPPSHCPQCDAEIRGRDNIPVLSWLILRGRCRDCGAHISARYPGVELLTGALFLLITLTFGLTWELPAYLYLTAVGVALAFIDLDTKRLPNVLTLPSYPIVAGLLLIPAVVYGQWGDFGRAMLGGLGALRLLPRAGPGVPGRDGHGRREARRPPGHGAWPGSAGGSGWSAASWRSCSGRSSAWA